MVYILTKLLNNLGLIQFKDTIGSMKPFLLFYLLPQTKEKDLTLASPAFLFLCRVSQQVFPSVITADIYRVNLQLLKQCV